MSVQLWGQGKFISLLNRIESSVKAFWTANGAGRWKKLKFGWTEMDLNAWSYHLGARIQGPAQAQLLQIEK